MPIKNTLKSWLLGTPIYFAITSFLFMILVTVLCGLFLPETSATFTTIGILISISTLVAAILSLRRLSGHKMDRISFINIHNAQSFIIIGASVLSLLCAVFMTPIKFWLFSLLQTKTGAVISIVLAITLVLVSLYVTGVALCNFWAKFWRAIDMKIPTWKIILSIPFGFTMTWLPGYFIPEKTTKKPTISTDTKWYKKLTDWILSSAKNAAITFTALTLLSGLVTGFSSVLLTFTFAMLFVIWALQSGIKKFTTNIGGTYASIAVITNVVMILYSGITLYLIN